MAIKIYKAKDITEINKIVDEKELAGETLINVQRIDEPVRTMEVVTAFARRSENRRLVSKFYEIIMRD